MHFYRDKWILWFQRSEIQFWINKNKTDHISFLKENKKIIIFLTSWSVTLHGKAKKMRQTAQRSSVLIREEFDKHAI